MGRSLEEGLWISKGKGWLIGIEVEVERRKRVRREAWRWKL